MRFAFRSSLEAHDTVGSLGFRVAAAPRRPGWLTLVWLPPRLRPLIEVAVHLWLCLPLTLRSRLKVFILRQLEAHRARRAPMPD